MWLPRVAGSRGEIRVERAGSVRREIGEEIEQRAGLCPERSPIDAQHEVDADFEREQAQHRRRAREEALDAGRGAVVVLEGERRGMAEPAGERENAALAAAAARRTGRPARPGRR